MTQCVPWCPQHCSRSLYQIKKGRSACLSSSAPTKPLRSAPRIKRRSRNGSKVTLSLFLLLRHLLLTSSIFHLTDHSAGLSALFAPRSRPDVHPSAETGAAVAPPRGQAEAPRAAAAPAGRAGGGDAEDAAAPGGQRPQAEAAGGHEEGAETYFPCRISWALCPFDTT